MKSLDLDIVRSQFPALSENKIFFDNAGGTQVARQVVERITNYLYHSNVQLGASYEVSQLSTNRVNDAREQWATLLNAGEEAEIILGPSTTMLLQNLSRSLVQTLKPGDEVIVTNCDHEANIGPWIAMQKYGITVKSWKINPENFKLQLVDLAKLMTDKTRLVAFTHVSNILGMINPVKEITDFVHAHGAMVCVDGVACAPHRALDFQKLGIDFYVFSQYKVYGPHYSLLYGKKEILQSLPGINHFFIGNSEIPYKLQPGNVNYELSYGSLGIIDYFNLLFDKHYPENIASAMDKYHKVFDLFTQHEEALAEKFLDFLQSKKRVKIIGSSSSSKDLRVPTISFSVDGTKSSEIPPKTDPYNIGIRWGDFYARRLITDLGLLDKDGVVRVSMVHYNTIEEIEKLIKVLDPVL